MEWALLDLPRVYDIVGYEACFNTVLSQYDMATIRSYDMTKFSAAIVTDILWTHPQVIVGGGLPESPFYAPPDEFARELQGRAAPVH